MAKEKSAGRPVKEINWEMVDRMIEAQCNSKQVAGYCGMDYGHFLKKFKEHHKIDFSDYSNQKALSGLAILQTAQYNKALNNGSKGNVQMLMYLGKVLLGQKDKDDKLLEDVADMKKKMDDFLDQMNIHNRNPVKES